MINGSDIRKKRKELGLTAQELADLLKVSKDNLYKWELGHRPSDPDDYRKLENWLQGIENVPRETHKPATPLNGNGHAPELNEFGGLLTTLMKQQNHLLEMQNKILADQKSEIGDKVGEIHSSLGKLSEVLAGVSSISLKLDAVSKVGLNGLARLEKKPAGQLIRELDKIVRNKIKSLKKQDK